MQLSTKWRGEGWFAGVQETHWGHQVDRWGTTGLEITGRFKPRLNGLKPTCLYLQQISTISVHHSLFFFCNSPPPQVKSELAAVEIINESILLAHWRGSSSHSARRPITIEIILRIWSVNEWNGDCVYSGHRATLNRDMGGKFLNPMRSPLSSQSVPSGHKEDKQKEKEERCGCCLDRINWLRIWFILSKLRAWQAKKINKRKMWKSSMEECSCYRKINIKLR